MASGDSEKGQQLAARKRRVDQVSALIWLMVGGFVIVESRELLYMDEFGPGPGFFPFWLGVIVTLLGIGLLGQAIIFKQEESISFFGKHAALQMVLVMVGFFVFVFFIEKTGFYLASGLLFLFLLWAVEKKGWKFSLAAAIVAGLALWAIFGVALKLQMPRGFFDLL